MQRFKTGWFNESQRHSLARRGFTTTKPRRRSMLRSKIKKDPWMFKDYLSRKEKVMVQPVMEDDEQRKRFLIKTVADSNLKMDELKKMVEAGKECCEQSQSEEDVYNYVLLKSIYDMRRMRGEGEPLTDDEKKFYGAKKTPAWKGDPEAHPMYGGYYARKRLSEGARVELEHRDTVERIIKEKPTPEKAAEWISEDHKKEFPGYYPALKKMEKGLEKSR